MALPLEGIRIVDFTHFLSGPYCSMLLGDLGAEVIKVERPDGGDVYREYGPKFINGVSTSFLAVNRNKKSIAVDIKTPEGRDVIRKLIGTADILVENYKVGTMEKLGFGYQEVSRLNPKLIYCSISGFGNTGPDSRRGGFDLILQGISGIMDVTGESDRPPVKVGVPITDIGAGIYAALAVLAAVIQREQTQQGQYIDASLLEAGIGFSSMSVVNFFADGKSPQRLGSASSQNAPYQAFQTQDGYINVGTGNELLWKRFCEVLDIAHLLDDPDYADNALRVKNQEALAAQISPAMAVLSTEECLQKLTEAGIPCGPIYSIGQTVEDPQVQDRGIITAYEHPQAGTVRSVGFPVRMSEVPRCVRLIPPKLGEHSRDLLYALGYAEESIEALSTQGVVKLGDEK